MARINKVIEAIPGETWVSAVEYPDGTLALEGIRPAEAHGVRCFAVTRIRFSDKAVEKLIPLMQTWLDQRKETS